MDPYEFAENGYRCTVTIGRLVPNASWWFPSCTRCSKSCVADGVGYRCNPCSNTSFKFKYKLCFVALDGTDEAEMICFGDIARRIIGKPVQQLPRTATSSNAYPGDIARLVSLRFTFAVTLTQQSYYRAQKSYQVTSVVTSHRQQVVVPEVAPDGNDGGTSSAGSDDILSEDATNTTDQRSPGSIAAAGLASPVQTPPPPLDIDETPGTKKQSGGRSTEGRRSGAKKRLNFDKPETTDQPAENSVGEDGAATEALDDILEDVADKGIMADNDLTPGKKRSRGGRCIIDDSD